MEKKQNAGYEFGRKGTQIIQAPNGSSGGSDAGRKITGTDLRTGK